MLNHRSIRSLAREIKRSSKDLIALSQVNDPFYADQKGRRLWAEWFAEQWERCGFAKGVHTRRIHYVLIGQATKPDGESYENTLNDWAALSKASRDARYLDLIPLDGLIDRRNDEPMIFTPENKSPAPNVDIEDSYPESLYVEDMPDLPSFRLDGLHPCQSHVVEVWVEKSTQNDWLLPLCERRGVTLVTGIGEQSEIRSRELVARAAEHGKPTRVIYISDFDPGGQSMPLAVARKAEYWISKFSLDLDFTLTPLVLTAQQCRTFSLPRTPIKDGDRRKDKFEQRYGRGATELDALEALYPGEMAKLLESEIDLYLDRTLEERAKEVRWQLEHRLREVEEEVCEPYGEKIAELEASYDEIIDRLKAWEEHAQGLWETIHDHLEEQEPNLSDYEPPKPREAREPLDALYDSKRDYFTQLDHYHQYQGRNGERT